MLGVDRNSIRRWMRAHPSNDDWRIIERMAGAQLVERVAKGLVKSSRDLATILGIAGRNVRAQELIARRDARREEAEQPTPVDAEQAAIREALDLLSPAQKRMFRNELDVEMKRRAYPDAEATAPRSDEDALSLLEFVQHIAALPDDVVAERTAASEAKLEEYAARDEAEWRARFSPDPEPVEPPAPADEPTPLPTARVARPASAPMVIDVGNPRGEPWFDTDTGERRPPRW